VLGVGYKRDVDDVRESPALDVIQLLAERGAHVSYHDPHVPALRLESGQTLRSAELSDAWLTEADCIVIVTDHSAYDWTQIVKHSRLIIDTRNATAKARNGQLAQGGSARVIRL